LNTIRFMRNAGRTELMNYMKFKKIKVSQLAKELDISRGHLNNILTGQREPSKKLTMRIFKATDGFVPPTSWIDYSEIM
jgi:transcriptional regulator with XRE-family HTH domain